MPHDDTDNNNATKARQPKLAKYNDYVSDSKIHEIRVLPPREFHHLLAKVDGVDLKVENSFPIFILFEYLDQE